MWQVEKKDDRVYLNDLRMPLIGSFEKDGTQISAIVYGKDFENALWDKFNDKYWMVSTEISKPVTVKVTGDLIVAVEKNKTNYFGIGKFHDSDKPVYFSYSK